MFTLHQTTRCFVGALACVTIGLLLLGSFSLAQIGKEIDWEKAKQLRRKAIQGQKLTKEEKAYLDRAMQLRKQLQKKDAKRPLPAGKASMGFVPLSDMTAKDRYKDQDGGLYGNGQNEPPKAHLEAALREAAKIQPLDADGKPAKDGKIVLISNGMSNTTQEFQAFMKLANSDPAKSPQVVLVDGAQGGMEALAWADPDRGLPKNRPSPWDVLEQRLKQAGVTPQQVQVVWILQARRSPASLGEFPKHAEELKGHLATIVNKLREKYPNLRLAYLSSRIYAGYATTGLNPEPYAYESAFSIRWLIQEQIKGTPALNHDPKKGKVTAPLLLWGPYLWADGEKGRKQDDLVWKREDLAADGTHPSDSGRLKVARQLLAFMKSDPTARVWFARAGGER